MKRKIISLSPAMAPTIKHNVADTLTQAILSGRIRPGERLNESQLSRDLAVSRAPIREALHQLAEQGLVMNSPRRGMFLVDLGDEDVRKIRDVRVILEAEAFRLARPNIPRPGFTRLEQILSRLERSRRSAPLRQVRLDYAFHSAVWSYCGNQYLERTLNSLVAPLFSHSVIMMGSAARTVHMMPHTPLLDYLRGKSPKPAFAVVAEHLEYTLSGGPEQAQLLSGTA
jgi:DNA-binding GntR family transcriptional regulator